MNMLIRLLFAQSCPPRSEYHLDVRDLTEFGRLLLMVADRYNQEPNLPGDYRFLKNELFRFANKSFRQMLFLYYPPGIKVSVQKWLPSNARVQ